MNEGEELTWTVTVTEITKVSIQKAFRIQNREKKVIT